MKLLFVAFINETHKQLLRKVNDQFKAFKKFNSQTDCLVMGQGGHDHDFSIYDFQYLNLDKIRGNSENDTTQSSASTCCGSICNRTIMTSSIFDIRVPIDTCWNLQRRIETWCSSIIRMN